MIFFLALPEKSFYTGERVIMRTILGYLTDSTLNSYSIAFRLFLSFVFSFLIGITREKKNQPAGLRTHILIGLGSTLLMLLSVFIPSEFRIFQNGDPGRIAAQVVSGIGFIGAGAILKIGANVRGLTTAASLWIVSAIGLATGAGMYFSAALTTAIALFTLVVLDRAEKKLFPTKYPRVLELWFKGNKIYSEKIFDILAKHGIEYRNVNISQILEKNSSSIKIDILVREDMDLKSLYDHLSALRNVSRVSIRDMQ